MTEKECLMLIDVLNDCIDGDFADPDAIIETGDTPEFADAVRRIVALTLKQAAERAELMKALCG